MECAYCLSHNQPCDAAVPRCHSCRSVNILCSAPPDHPIGSSALRTADGPLAHHPTHRALSELNSGLSTAISVLAQSVLPAADTTTTSPWSSTLGFLPTSFPLGSIPLSCILALHSSPDTLHGNASSQRLPHTPIFRPQLQPQNVLDGYMAEFVSGCLLRYPLFSPEKVITMSERYASLIARHLSPDSTACTAAAPADDYASAMLADPHDLIVYLLLLAIGSLLEARRTPVGPAYAACSGTESTAPVPGLALFIEACVALSAQHRLSVYKSLKAWRVRAWFLIGIYYEMLGLREAAQEAAARAAEMLLSMGAKTGLSNLAEETTADGEVLMIFWSLAQFQMDICTDDSAPNLFSSLQTVPLPTHAYFSARGFAADYGFSHTVFTLFCDRFAFLRLHVDAAATPTTSATLAEREAFCTTRSLGSSQEALCRGGGSEVAALAWTKAQRARALSAVYRPLVQQALAGGQGGDMVLRGVEVLKKGVEVDEKVFGAWSALGTACYDVLLITQVCESLDLRCSVHADTAQAMADRMAQHLSAIMPSTLAMAAEAHLAQYAQLRG